MKQDEEKKAHSDFWRTLCQTVAAQLVDQVLIEARERGVDDLTIAEGLVVFSNEVALVVAEAIEELSEGRR